MPRTAAFKPLRKSPVRSAVSEAVLEKAVKTLSDLRRSNPAEYERKVREAAARANWPLYSIRTAR